MVSENRVSENIVSKNVNERVADAINLSASFSSDLSNNYRYSLEELD